MKSAAKFLVESSQVFLLFPQNVNSLSNVKENVDDHLTAASGDVRRQKEGLSRCTGVIRGVEGNRGQKPNKGLNQLNGNSRGPLKLFRSSVNPEVDISVGNTESVIDLRLEFVPRTEAQILHKLSKETDEVPEDNRISGTCKCCDKSLNPVFGKRSLRKLTKCHHVFHYKCLQKEAAAAVNGNLNCRTCGEVYFKGIGHGPMPRGFLIARCSPGNEHIKCTYEFPEGIQSRYHPNPGKPYPWLKDNFFLPNTKDGRRLLLLLCVAFLRGDTFTIVKSRPNDTGTISAPAFRHRYTPESLRNDSEFVAKLFEQLAALHITKERYCTEERLQERLEEIMRKTKHEETDVQIETSTFETVRRKAKHECHFSLVDTGTVIDEEFRFVPKSREDVLKKLEKDTEEVSDLKNVSGTCSCCSKNLKRFVLSPSIRRLPKCKHVFHTNCIRDQLEKTLDGEVNCNTCNTPYSTGLGHGPMPKGKLRMRCKKGDEYIRCYYRFHRGVHAPYHLYPGKQYPALQHGFFLPNTREGRIVAYLMSLSFADGNTYSVGRTNSDEYRYYISAPRFPHEIGTGGLKNPNKYLAEVVKKLADLGYTKEAYGLDKIVD